jgi:hypothetical protein
MMPALAGDPTLSPFIAPAPTSSPAFTELRITPDCEDSDHTETPPRSSSDKPSPEQE